VGVFAKTLFKINRQYFCQFVGENILIIFLPICWRKYFNNIFANMLAKIFFKLMAVAVL
jgi:hypothetical protein